MFGSIDKTAESREPHEHDGAAWAKHREAQREPYRQPDLDPEALER